MVAPERLRRYIGRVLWIALQGSIGPLPRSPPTCTQPPKGTGGVDVLGLGAFGTLGRFLVAILGAVALIAALKTLKVYR